MTQTDEATEARSNEVGPWRQFLADLRSHLPLFLLTAVVGGGITYFYQHLASSQQIRAAEIAADRAAAREVADEIGRTLSRRLMIQQRRVHAFSPREARAIDVATTTISQSDSAWFENADRLRALACRYFGAESLSGLIRLDVDIMVLGALMNALDDEYNGKNLSPELLKALGVDSAGSLASRAGDLGDSLHVALFRWNLRASDQIRLPALASSTDARCEREEFLAFEYRRAPLYWTGLGGLASSDPRRPTRR